MLNTFKFTWSYVISQIKRKRRSFHIGASTIIIVVAFISLLYSTIDKAGLVFLKLAEIKVGENDLILTNSMQIQMNNDSEATLPLIMNFSSTWQTLMGSTMEPQIKGLTYEQGTCWTI